VIFITFEIIEKKTSKLGKGGSTARRQKITHNNIKGAQYLTGNF
jgi:hypothetical protein